MTDVSILAIVGSLRTESVVALHDAAKGIGRYGDKLNEHGEFTDPQTGADLADFVSRFAEHCSTSASPPAV